jgi:hypothetical protein
MMQATATMRAISLRVGDKLSGLVPDTITHLRTIGIYVIANTTSGHRRVWRYDDRVELDFMKKRQWKL